ncbi:RNA-binding (RRM/RBD/RNP motifs) family protein [Rhynchospora pubera]|uniref:RNA-binding (RRM/RBD/RNP motifs) family protein n=1 Tax=Rhynchospora pubera TaxID=906938 RepID=A0AAV8EZD0_9POAL|nr:RNA-binding (RRM/RBD/RNP motifs) family protein [Rhynchospora pubera]
MCIRNRKKSTIEPFKKEHGGGAALALALALVMASDEPKPANKDKKNNRKKVKKDKWGQPLPPESEEREAEELLETVKTAAAEPETAPGSGAGRGEDSYEANKVVASGMPYSTTEEEIREMFEQCGPIFQLQLSRFPDSGNFRGLAFITFESESAAISALSLDGTKMGDRFVRVEKCRVDQKRKRKAEFLADPEKAKGCLSAYIGNLSWNVTEDDIIECFNTSKISSVRFAFDKITGKSRGFCHVDFEDDESLEKAIQKNQTEFHGRPMKIAYAVSNRS